MTHPLLACTVHLCHMRKALLSFAFLAIILGISCNNPRKALSSAPLKENDPRWVRVDSLANLGQYASALALTDTILAEARSGGDFQLEFRAMMQRAQFQQMTGIEAPVIIGEFEARATAASFPLNALLHSVVGEQYWSYYQQQRWEILQRTATQDDPKDMATWSQPTFMRKVIAEYRASLTEVDSLKSIPVGNIARILADPKADTALRPMLFDLLAHRALDVFRNSETRLAEPASHFTLKDPRAFALFEDFAFKPFAHKDSGSWELQALQLYQQLERSHVSDSKPDALVDVALARLSYVRERSTLGNKDTLYLRALETLATRVPNDSCWSAVTVDIARWHSDMGAKFQRLAPDAYKWERKTALEFCDAAIKKHPGSAGALDAEVLRSQLLDKSMQVQCEQAVLPTSPFKAAITYRNVPEVWVRLVKDDRGTDEYLQNNGNADGTKLVERKALREWSVALPDDGDLNEHLTEIAVDGLPFGHYALIISDRKTFEAKKDDISHTRFWVTRLAMTQRWQQGNLDLLVVDRGTGVPKAGVGVVPWSRNYREGNVFKRASERTATGADGFLRIPVHGADGSIGWELVDGEDRYISAQTWFPNHRDGQQAEDIRTFLFTDRAIYRPGQPVMFKGIVTRKNGKSTEVVPGVRTTVELFDVNGEKVDSLAVTTRCVRFVPRNIQRAARGAHRQHVVEREAWFAELPGGGVQAAHLRGGVRSDHRPTEAGPGSERERCGEELRRCAARWGQGAMDREAQCADALVVRLGVSRMVALGNGNTGGAGRNGLRCTRSFHCEVHRGSRRSIPARVQTPHSTSVWKRAPRISPAKRKAAVQV